MERLNVAQTLVYANPLFELNSGLAPHDRFIVASHGFYSKILTDNMKSDAYDSTLSRKMEWIRNGGIGNEAGFSDERDVAPDWPTDAFDPSVLPSTHHVPGCPLNGVPGHIHSHVCSSRRTDSPQAQVCGRHTDTGLFPVMRIHATFSSAAATTLLSQPG